MKIHLAGLLVSLFLSLFLQAQKSQPVNSGAIIAEGIRLHDEGKYKEAIEQYKKVPVNDTNYAFAVYEVAYSQAADKDINGAISTIRHGLSLEEDDYELDFLILLGNCIDDQGDGDHAIRVYDSALAKFPNAQMLLLNKSISYIRMKKTDEAEKILKDLLVRNPYYPSAHFRLGQCALQRGQLVQATMCFFTYLINSPSGPQSNTIIKLLGNISKSTDDVIEVVNKRTEQPSGNFAMVEQILLSKIALDKSYKVQTELDDPIIRQLQVMMEKLEFDASDPDFYMQFYVPYLKALFSQKMFEPAVYRAFSDVNIETIQKYLKKNAKAVEAAKSLISEHFSSIRATRELDYEKRKSAAPLYHFDEGVLIAKGKLVNEKMEGSWLFYHPNGNVKSAGEYLNGKQHGKWTFYLKNGRISGYENYQNGELHGEDITFNRYGVVTNRAFYKNGKLDGEKTSYYSLGHPYSVSTYKDGVETGKYIQYHTNGRKKIDAETADNQLHGQYLSFHENGKPHIVANYVKGKLNGAYKTYYDNGKLEFTANYKDDEPEGEFQTFHTNGKLKRKATYVAGKLEGDELQYNSEGVLVQKVPYKKGKAEGLAEYFDDDGKLFSTFYFDNDRLKTARYFDKSGKEISISERKNKMIRLVVYDPDGFKLSEVTYDDEARKQGEEVYYHPNGQVKEKNYYKDGLLQGLTTGYYCNGNKEYEVNFADDKKHGFVKNYFMNGRLSSEGWYTDGQLNGDWYEYNEKGDLISITTYLEGDIYGIKRSFHPNGKPEDEEGYRFGWFASYQQFDTSGNKLHFVALTNGSGKYRGIYPNQKTRFEGEYVNGEPHGPFKIYFFDGSLQVSKNYDKGLLDGTYIDYYHGGKIYSEGKYDLGKRTGVWKYYGPDGKLIREEKYLDGSLHGESVYYFPNGKPERIINYIAGDRHGIYKRFAHDGQLALIMRYEHDIPVAYAYLDKNNQQVPFIPIPRDRGAVKAYYANGKTSAEMEFVNGLLNGPYKVYHPDGKVYYEEDRLDCGLTSGKLREYYPNGQLKFEYHYDFDVQNGPFIEYHENGKLKEEGQFYNGLLHGARKMYDANGKLTETRHYYYGTLINITK